jgi:regulatory protein
VGSDRNRPPLDAAGVERLALDYVARYATTRAKLRDYLNRKLRERGWAGDSPPPTEAMIARLAELGAVDDRAFAASRSASLARRGYGARRVGDALRAAGIDADDAAPAIEQADAAAWRSAEAFAKRRRIGPFSTVRADPDQRRRAFAAMLRAGHSPAIAHAFTAAAPGDVPQGDNGDSP